jgi:glycosyltransferase involved in cell wall biosynthesis
MVLNGRFYAISAISETIKDIFHTIAMKHITIVTHCYNQDENVRELYEGVKKVMSSLYEYSYEHIFIDNASKDRTVDILRQIAGHDRNVKPQLSEKLSYF